MIQVGIIGGAGYTAGELLRLLVNHPEVEIVFVQSNSQAGKAVTSIHTDLIGELELDFTQKPGDAEVYFLCSGHGKSRAFLAEHPFLQSAKIIDLSNDFRLAQQADGFVYGLPELNRERIKKASKIANPGCFATAIQLALLPLAEAGALKNEVHIHAITGSTGAGQRPSATTHFSWRSSNVSVYKAFTHQHLDEIRESLQQLSADFQEDINFIPVRGNFTRGIFASLYTVCDLSLAEAYEAYTASYASHPFVHVVKDSPALKQVVNTNKCLLHLQKHGNKLHITSVIDNLLKGASGQAVQNMNLLFGLEEKLGLHLKPSAF